MFFIAELLFSTVDIYRNIYKYQLQATLKQHCLHYQVKEKGDIILY